MDPLHITEFASERYFSKLKQLNQNAENGTPSSAVHTSVGPTAAAVPPPFLPQSTFILPLGNPRQRDAEPDIYPLRPSDQKKRSLGHDLTALRSDQRRPKFMGGFGRLTSKVTVTQKIPSIVEVQEHIAEVEGQDHQRLTLSDLFLSLPNELQEQIIASLPIHDVLELRLVSKSFHTLVSLNESTIARYHIAHTLPEYAMKLYPVPSNPCDVNLHYICSIWHRLIVASKLAIMISRQVVKEIFLQTTEQGLRDFEPQHQRMRERLMRIIFTLFHFFETYRNLHVQHLTHNGTPLNLQAFLTNPIERQVMAMYDDQTLLQVHQAWTLVISSFSRRLRPPSYVGTLEAKLKGYLKARPPDEVYTTILTLGGMRQAQRFWETKGYNARRGAVDTWYELITKTPVAPEPVTALKTKMSMLNLMRKKKDKEVDVQPSTSNSEGVAHHSTSTCNEWFCVKPDCQAARKRHSTDNLVFHSSLSAGPPMSPLTRAQLQLVLPDLQHLTNIWVHTAEAMILERKIVERPQDIKKNAQVLLELIRDDGVGGLAEWSSGNTRAQTQSHIVGATLTHTRTRESIASIEEHSD